jgi:hypothetical protein
VRLRLPLVATALLAACEAPVEPPTRGDVADDPDPDRAPVALAGAAPWQQLLEVPEGPVEPPWEPGDLWPAGVGWVDATEASGVDYAPAPPAETPPHSALGLCGGGAAVTDLDGDGVVDLLQVSRWAQPMLWLGVGDGTFVPAPEQPFTTDWAVGVLAADLDGDGLREVLLLDGETVRPWRNLGGGAFVEEDPLLVTDDYGRLMGGVLADVDADGSIDLFVTAYGGDGPDGTLPSGDRLLLGRGDRTFVDATDLLPDDRHGMGFAATVLDYDRDGRLDLYVVNDKGSWGGPNRLYRNTGDGFVDSPEFGLNLAVDSMGVATGDLNGDGVPEVLVSDTLHDLHLLESSEFGAIDVALARGLSVQGDDERSNSWGPLLHDVDHDGDLDVLFAFGALFTGQTGLERRLGLWLSKDEGLEAAHELLPDRLATQFRAVLPADLDGDGDLDFVITHADGVVDIALAEPTGRAWLQVELRGPAGNREGLGAEVVVESSVGTQRRRIHAGGTGVHGVFEPIAHVGLGESDAVGRVLVRWPDGEITDVRGLRGNRRLVVEHPDAD